MLITIVRIFFVALFTLFGHRLGSQVMIGPDNIWGLIGAGIGLVTALMIIIIDLLLKKSSMRSLSCIIVGLFFGLVMTSLIMKLFALISLSDTARLGLRLVIALSLSYLGIIIALRNQDEFNLIIPYVKFNRQGHREEVVVLDTSVIIDGRIADICETKFVGGKFIVPRFVLKELQVIADSSDTLKRNRGRRGLDVLNKIQKNVNMDVKIHEADFPEISEVDGKLVKLAMLLNARVFTNDYNLNKVAEIQGVSVLNINELANALKPVVLPGEIMEIKIIKEGKEHGQGVAYLDDGTMIVVDNAKVKIGQIEKVTVTSVLQTQAGRMIFAKLGG